MSRNPYGRRASGAALLFTTAAALLAASARPPLSAAPDHEGARAGPKVTIVSPAAGAVSSSTINVAIDWCDDTGLDVPTRSILLNGVDVSSNFSTVTNGGTTTCTIAHNVRHYSTGSVTLSPGSNTLVASIDDIDGFTGTNSKVYSLPTGRAVTAATILARTGARTSRTGTTAATGFTVTNSGTETATFSLSASCDGAVTSSCSPSPTSVSLSPGQSSSVTVTYSTGGTAGATGLVKLVTTTGEPRDSSWTEVRLESAPAAGLTVVAPVGSSDSDHCVTIAAGPGAAAACGDLRIAHALPATRTMGESRVPTLLYSVATAMPMPLVAADFVTGLDGASRLPDSIRASVTIGGTVVGTGTWNGNAWPAANTRRRIVVAVTGADTMATGAYDFTLTVTSFWPGSSGSDVATGTLPVVNRRASPYGAGWWVAGVERIVPISTSHLLWIGGDGSTRIYTQDPGASSVYRAPQRSRPDSITAGGAYSGWVRHAPMGGVVEFNGAGQHRRSTNRLGHATEFTYTGGGGDDPLSTITLPTLGATAQYTFSYASGKLSSVSAPASRSANMYISAARVDSIRDADNTVVRFAYGASPNGYRVASRTDRRGYATSYSYDLAHRLATHSRTATGMATITVTVAAAETKGLPGHATHAAAQPLDSISTAVVGPRTDVTQRTEFWTSGLGLPYRIRDPLGRETVLRYDTTWPALVATSRAPNGLLSRTAYDSRGLASASIVYSPLGGADSAVTTYAWHTGFEVPTSVTAPGIDAMQFGYDASTGNRTWQQPGNDANRRVTFGYDAATGLLDSITTPLSPPELLFHDNLGNVTRVRSPLGYHTRFVGDAAGRDTLVVTPVDATDFGYSSSNDGNRLRERRTFDAAGQLTAVERLAPTTATPSCTGCILSNAESAKSLSVENTYDAEGNLTHVIRSSNTTANGIIDVTTQSWYDPAGRKTQERLLGAPVNSRRLVYDPAGNVIADTTPRGDVITRRYDAAGRLLEQVTPARSYAAANCSTLFTADANGRHSPCVAAFDTLTIPLDTARYRYDALGAVLLADNNDARVDRRYFPSGALKSDQVAMRNWGSFAFTNHVYALQYRYDLAGRRTVLKHPSGLAPARDSVVYGYASWGPLSQITGLEGETYAFTYDDAGRLRKTTYPGSVTDSVRFDGESRVVRRLVQRPGETLVDDTLTFLPSAQIATATMNGSVAQGGGWAQSWYDGFGAVIATAWQNASNAGANADQYRYDAHGNPMLARKWDSGTRNDTLTYEYDGVGRLVTIWPPAGGSASTGSFSYRDYDVAGNATFSADVRKTSGSSTWTTTRSYYGADERLRRVVRKTSGPTGSRSDVVEDYRTDALGRRVLKNENHAGLCDVGTAECTSAITRFVWDGAELLYELRYAASGSDIAVGSRPYGGKIAYVHGAGIDRPLGVLLDADSLIVPHVNWRGSYVTGTYASGARVSDVNVTWDAARVRVSFEGGALDGHWWGGLLKEQRDASGLLYRRNRYYDPQTGRFTQVDPIGLAGGLNLYGFAGGDPVNFGDAFGLCPTCENEAMLRIQVEGMEKRTGRDVAAMLGAGAVAAVGGVALAAATSAVLSTAAAIAPAIPKLSQDLTNTFEGGKYAATRLASDMRVYRVFDGENAGRVGRWFTTVAQSSSSAAQGALNLYNNNATRMVEAVIPRGTTVYMGPIAGSSNSSVQVFVPNAAQVVRFGAETILKPWR